MLVQPLTYACAALKSCCCSPQISLSDVPLTAPAPAGTCVHSGQAPPNPRAPFQNAQLWLLRSSGRPPVAAGAQPPSQGHTPLPPKSGAVVGLHDAPPASTSPVARQGGDSLASGTYADSSLSRSSQCKVTELFGSSGEGAAHRCPAPKATYSQCHVACHAAAFECSWTMLWPSNALGQCFGH